MKKFFALSVTLAIPATLLASPPLDEVLQPSAAKVAQQRGASELGCPAATTEVLSKHAIEEPQMGGWYEFPQSAEYTIAVSGCGKRTAYLVACKKFRSACEAGPVPTGSTAPRQLADELQPDAVKAAQERGARDFSCPATTAEVTRQETIAEGETTGWGAEAPSRAAYTVTVKGCNHHAVYIVECTARKSAGCATAHLQPSQAGSKRPELADELQSSAVQEAKERGSKELECPAAGANVTRKETIEEGQTTGWYDPPYRAIYAITVSGCSKQAAYLVTCNKKQNRCVAGSPDSK